MGVTSQAPDPGDPGAYSAPNVYRHSNISPDISTSCLAHNKNKPSVAQNVVSYNGSTPRNPFICRRIPVRLSTGSSRPPPARAESFRC